jgi:hypothetical protein
VLGCGQAAACSLVGIGRMRAEAHWLQSDWAALLRDRGGGGEGEGKGLAGCSRARLTRVRWRRAGTGASVVAQCRLLMPKDRHRPVGA